MISPSSVTAILKRDLTMLDFIEFSPACHVTLLGFVKLAYPVGLVVSQWNKSLFDTYEIEYFNAPSTVDRTFILALPQPRR